MNNFRVTTILMMALAALLLVGCSSNKDLYKGMTEEQIYTQAKQNVEKEKFAQAAKDFEALEARYPYGQYSDKAQLGLINAYYRHNESALGLTTADHFIRMNPRHPEVDYAHYLKGLIAYDENYGFMFRYLPLDKSTRDLTHAQTSFDSFKTLLERFPNSKYAKDARQRMLHLREMFANHELEVARFYIKRGAYLSAANRASYVVKHFDQTKAMPEALAAMVESYRALKMTKLADDAYHTLKVNFPNSEALKSVR